MVVQLKVTLDIVMDVPESEYHDRAEAEEWAIANWDYSDISSIADIHTEVIN